MRRREFITLIGGAAAAWPIEAGAQQGERMRRIGVLMNTAADDTVFQTRIGAFLQGQALLGWTIGSRSAFCVRFTSTGEPKFGRVPAIPSDPMPVVSTVRIKPPQIDARA